MNKQQAQNKVEQIIKLIQQLPPNKVVEDRTAKILEKLYEEAIRASRAISSDKKLN